MYIKIYQYYSIFYAVIIIGQCFHINVYYTVHMHVNYYFAPYHFHIFKLLLEGREVISQGDL